MELPKDSWNALKGVMAFAVLGLILLLCPFIRAQVTGATLSGTITDPSGAVIPKAKVTITNTATGVITIGATNSAGLYTVPNLIAGPYTVSISAKGFQTEVRSGITLVVGTQQVLNVTLQIGKATQTVSVTGQAPTVQLASSTMSAEVNSTTVRQLPLNGRDWTQLATLQPGVNSIPVQQPNGATAVRGNRGFGSQLAISGLVPQLNNYRIDGISVVDYIGGSPGSVNGVALGVDAIAEFSVITANQSASYGRTAGGVVNAITRSGTNNFHGDAYEFVRNSAMDARNYFDASIPPFSRNQFGASAGGPIQKNKTFFFADYEGLRQNLGITNFDLVPSADARNGIIHNSNGTTTNITVDPKVKPYFAFYPLPPNATLVSPGNTERIRIETSNDSTENYATVRIDHTFSNTDSLYGTWFYDNAVNKEPDALNNWFIGNSSLRNMVSLEETHIFSPTFVNSFRLGYYRMSELSNTSQGVINPLASNTSLGAFPGVNAPVIHIPGVTLFSGGANALTAPDATWNSIQVYDDAFLTKGDHSLKFGFAFENDQTNYGIIGNTGQFFFSSLTDFLTNNPFSFTGRSPSSEFKLGIRQSLFGAYFQDDWRIRRNLTVNLGVRYEMLTVPKEEHNRLATLHSLTSPTPHLGSPLFNNPTLRNFEPRVGFAWDPFGNGKTSVRGAFGMFDALPFYYEFFVSLANSSPYAVNVTAPSGSLPQGSFPSAAVTFATPSFNANNYTEPNPPRNYVMIWNLNIQRQVAPNTTVMLGYIGNHGVHMIQRPDEMDDVLPTQTSAGLLWPFPAGSGTRINPNFGQIRGQYWGGSSLYDALQAQVTKRMGHGVQVQGSYTWGRAIDTGSAVTIGDPFTNSISSPYWFCPRCRRGPADFNVSQTLVVNYVWDIPTPKGWGALASNVLGGWELGGIITAESGVPMSVTISGDPLGLNNADPWAFPNRLTSPGCGSLVNPGNPTHYIKLSCFGLPTAPSSLLGQCTPYAPNGIPAIGTCKNLLGTSGRNILYGPGIETWNFSLIKNTYIRKISENFDAQFRAEFFNFLNRTNFALPTSNEALFDSSGNPVPGAGSIDSVSVPAREIQLAIKLIW